MVEDNQIFWVHTRITLTFSYKECSRIVFMCSQLVFGLRPSTSSKEPTENSMLVKTIWNITLFYTLHLYIIIIIYQSKVNNLSDINRHKTKYIYILFSLNCRYCGNIVIWNVSRILISHVSGKPPILIAIIKYTYNSTNSSQYIDHW